MNSAPTPRGLEATTALAGEGGIYSVALRMTQEGRPVLSALVRTATDGEGHEHQEAPPPVVAPEESEPILRVKDGNPLFPFWGNFNCRRAELVEGEVEEREGRAAIREWVRFEPVANFADPFLEAARPLVLLGVAGRVWSQSGHLLASGGAQLKIA